MSNLNVQRGDKLLYAAVEDLKKGDEVLVKQFDLVIGVLDFSEKQQEEYFQVFTNADDLKKKVPTIKCSTSKFHDTFGVLPLFPKSYIEREMMGESNDSKLAENLEKAASEIEAKDTKIKELEAKIKKLEGAKLEVSAKDNVSVGFFTGVSETVDDLLSLNLELVQSGKKLKGQLVINGLPALKIGGTVSELDNELLDAIKKVHGDNAMLIMNVAEYAKALEEKAAELKKETSKTAAAAKKETVEPAEKSTEKKEEKKEEKPVEKEEKKSPDLFKEENKSETEEEKPSEPKTGKVEDKFPEEVKGNESEAMDDDDW